MSFVNWLDSFFCRYGRENVCMPLNILPSKISLFIQDAEISIVIIYGISKKKRQKKKRSNEWNAICYSVQIGWERDDNDFISVDAHANKLC